MKDKWGNERNTWQALSSYLPPKLRITLAIPVMCVMIPIVCVAIFTEMIWFDGLKYAFKNIGFNFQRMFVENTELVKILWCCEEDPLKPKHDEKTENE